jgi:Cu-processing system permease protein
MRAVRQLFLFELAAARRARAVSIFAVAFALACLVVAFVGQSASGAVVVQGFARTSASLMQLVLWVVPLLALLTGASVAVECLEIPFIVSLPIARNNIVLARWLAWFVALGAAMLVGLGLAGVVIGLVAGGSDTWRYLRLIGVAEFLLAVTLALGFWVGITSRSRVRATTVAVVTWLALVVGTDLIAIGILSIVPNGHASWWLSALLMTNPVDSARTLGISLLQADLVTGSMGASLGRVLHGAGVWALLVALLAWTIFPLSRATRRFTRIDL